MDNQTNYIWDGSVGVKIEVRTRKETGEQFYSFELTHASCVRARTRWNTRPLSPNAISASSITSCSRRSSTWMRTRYVLSPPNPCR